MPCQSLPEIVKENSIFHHIEQNFGKGITSSTKIDSAQMNVKDS